MELLLVGGGALSIEEALHRLAQPLHLLLVKDPFPGHQAGAEGEVLPGALIVLHVVVAVVDPAPVIVPGPGDELGPQQRLCPGQHCAVELCQHPVTVRQAIRLQRCGILQKCHVLHHRPRRLRDLGQGGLCPAGVHPGGVIPDDAALRDPAQDAAVPLHREQAVLLQRPGQQLPPPQGVGQFLEIGFFGHVHLPPSGKMPFFDHRSSHSLESPIVPSYPLSKWDEKVCALFGSTNKVGALCHPSPTQIENALFELPGQQKAPA